MDHTIKCMYYEHVWTIVQMRVRSIKKPTYIHLNNSPFTASNGHTILDGSQATQRFVFMSGLVSRRRVRVV